MAATKTKTKAAADEKGPEAAPKSRPAPVEGAAVADPLAPVSHAHSKDDVAIRVPKSAGAYGLNEGGVQVIHDVAPLDEGGGMVKVHRDHATNFLRNVEGSKLMKPGELTPEQEAIEAGRPQGRVVLAPLSDEEFAAAQEQAKLAGAATAREQKAAKLASKTSAKK